MARQLRAVPGNLKELASCLEATSARRVFLVTGKDSFISSGCAQRLEPVLADRQVQRFHDFESNPKIADIHRGVELFSCFSPDTVVAVGGGSVIDMAKIVNFWAANDIHEGTFFDGVGQHISKGLPLIAIPTTAGSGSEATRFATLYDGGIKRSVEHDWILPDFVILDPALTESLPPGVTAATGMDALAHSMESYWSIRSTGESKDYARRSIELIFFNLASAVNSPDIETRTAMLEGAHLAGKAINITRTTAVHALSYPLTSHFNIPHGHAVALSLPLIYQYNAGVNEENVRDPRGSEYVLGTLRELASLFGAHSVNEARKRIEDLIRQTGLETKLSRLGVQVEDIGKIVAGELNIDRAGNNPRLVTKVAVRDMLTNIF